MSQSPALSPVEVEPLPDTTAPVLPVHREVPAALRQLWHYDPDYAYDAARYTYGAWHTTDPYYLKADVRLLEASQHRVLTRQVSDQVITLCRLRGEVSPVLHEELLITDVAAALALNPFDPRDLAELAELGIYLDEQDIDELMPDGRQGAPRQRKGIAPDGSLWPSGTPAHHVSSLSQSRHGAPLLVVECLSSSTETKDRKFNPLGYKRMGVREYWICDPEGKEPIYGYMWDEEGNGGRVDARTEDGSVYSEVLRTRIRNHPEHGFQCQHPDPDSARWLGDSASEKLRHFCAGYVKMRCGESAATEFERLLNTFSAFPEVSPEDLDAFVSAWQGEPAQEHTAWLQRFASDTGPTSGRNGTR